MFARAGALSRIFQYVSKTITISEQICCFCCWILFFFFFFCRFPLADAVRTYRKSQEKKERNWGRRGRGRKRKKNDKSKSRYTLANKNKNVIKKSTLAKWAHKTMMTTKGDEKKWNTIKWNELNFLGRDEVCVCAKMHKNDQIKTKEKVKQEYEKKMTANGRIRNCVDAIECAHIVIPNKQTNQKNKKKQNTNFKTMNVFIFFVCFVLRKNAK